MLKGAILKKINFLFIGYFHFCKLRVIIHIFMNAASYCWVSFLHDVTETDYSSVGTKKNGIKVEETQ